VESSAEPKLAGPRHKSKPPDIWADDRVLLAWHRSHLANERTFLSWSRTSISLLAFGFVIEKFEVFLNHFLRLQGMSPQAPSTIPMSYLSLFSFILAAVAILFSGLRFLRVRKHVNQGEASFSILPDLLVVMSVMAIVVMAMLLIMPRIFAVEGPGAPLP
jgi:putative membrane protein